METLWTVTVCGLFVMNLFGISQEVKDSVCGDDGRIWGGIVLSILLGAWAIWRLDIVLLFSDRLDTAFGGAVVLTSVWTFLSWLYCRWKY